MTVLYINNDKNTALVSGLEMPVAKIVARTESMIAIRIPGHSYLSGLRTRSYARAEHCVYQYCKSRVEDGYYKPGNFSYDEALDVEGRSLNFPVRPAKRASAS